MHIGWSTIGALTVATCLPRIKGFPIGWVIGGFHITMMTLTVMATGNHYFLDEVGGWLVVAASLAACLVPDGPLPVQAPQVVQPHMTDGRRSCGQITAIDAVRGPPR